MLKKMLSCAAFLLLACVVCAVPVKVVEKFAVAPESAAVKAGEIVKLKLVFECVPGAKIGSFKAFVHRKEAPAEFLPTYTFPLPFINPTAFIDELTSIVPLFIITAL